MKPNTCDIFSRFCDQKFQDDEKRSRIYNALVRDELLAEESRLGKSFFEFDEDEIEQYLLKLSNQAYYKGKSIRISQSYLRNLASYYRLAFQFYIEESGKSWNPLTDDRFRHIGSRSKNDLPIFSRDTLERICLSVGEHFDEGDAEFTQLLLWLFYSGVERNDEIINIRDEDIDWEAGTISLHDRTIYPQNDCMDLLKKNHQIDQFRVGRLTNLMLPYHDSYVRFPIRLEKAPDNSDPYEYAFEQHQKRDIWRIKDIISKRFARVRNEIGVFVQPSTLYYRGIFDYIVSQCGMAHAGEIIWAESNRNTIENAEEFNRYLKEYGAKVSARNDIFKIKGNLRAFLP